ncbi:MAG: hypothetical protein E7620_01910 [Ruminococcaceae bacterium]|nr:hypothetical protein [Oscillospiraceae bacterium]
MTKKHLLLLSLLVLTLTLLLSGCGRTENNLDGKYVATFHLNGGTLDLKSFNVSTKINYAYDPNSLILDPSGYSNYEIYRSGYNFTGWYTSPDCRPEERWDFNTNVIDRESLALYAGWEKKISYTYSVCYKNGEETVVLGTYSVEPDAVFEDYRKHANKRDGFTAKGFYSDAACTTPWDFTTKHPGGDTDTDIPVYVDYVEGDWILVDTYDKLIAAKNSGNIYLTADIDCQGQPLSFSGTFDSVFEGNGFTVSNFTVEKSGGKLMPTAAIFQTLGANAEIRNVNFTNVTYQFMDVDGASKVKVAALARDCNGGKLENVTVSGVLKTNSATDFTESLTKPVYEEKSPITVNNFTANITVEKVETNS